VTTDITTLKRTEQALREANASLEIARQAEERRKQIAESLRGVLTILNSTRSPREVLQYIVRQAEALLGSAAAVIYGPDLLTNNMTTQTQVEALATMQDGDLATSLRVQAAEGLRFGGRRPRPHQHLPFADAAVEQVLMAAQPVAVVDGRSGPAPRGHVASESEAAEAHATAGDGDMAIAPLDGELPAPYQALLVVPIRVHDRLYGCLLLLYPQSRRFEAEEVALAQAYADQVALAITNTRLQVHLEQEAAAAERNRLAQELHDTVKQELFSASLVAQSLPTVWQTHRAKAEAALQQLHAMTQSAYAGLQALLLELRPAALEQMPLAESLRQLAAAMSTRAGVPVVVDVEGSATLEPPLPAAVKIACYRVAQEALMNAVKYAHAHAIRLRLRTKGANWLELELADDGRGFDPEGTLIGHFGLPIMRERAQAVGANLQVQSRAGQGTVVSMTWRRGRSDRP
jgi:two-component system nitrate/nitrite sensor histidine kinase NarX